jgi:serine/threonine-protein kinase
MNKGQYNWHELWELFERIILQPQNTHLNLIKKANITNQYLLEELQNLLKAHYSESTVLDKQPQWQSDLIQAFKPPIEIQGYTIKKKLGSGGVGDVYLACKSEEGFERNVAIKFATTGRFAQHVLTSFNRELEILLSLNHLNIERLYDGGITKENIPFLIVEYIDGNHIDRYCDEKKLNIEQRLMLFQKICQATDVVHRSLIVHRDIKASNIMVNKDGQPKLLDFGLAKLTNTEGKNKEASQTISSMMMTLAYASPEQVNGAQITTISDIYSLGVLLYYLLTGNLPYKVEANNLASSIKIITEHIPLLASKNIKIDSVIHNKQKNLAKKLKGDLEHIIAKALAKQPEDRYHSATAFSDDIQNFLKNRPVTAKKDTLINHIVKFIQRHVISVLLSSTAILSLVFLTIMLSIQSHNLQKSIEEISQEQNRVIQVTAFLQDMFKISDPLVTDANIIQVKDLLNYASQHLNRQFNDEPITKASLYETLGNVHLNMSHLVQAQNHFSKAEEFFQQEHYKPGLMRLYLSRTRLLQQQDKIKLAQSELSSLLKQFTFDSLSPEIQSEIEVLQGQNYYHLGNFTKAKQLLESSLEKRIQLFGQSHQQVVDIYQLLGNVYWRLGDFSEVKKQYTKSYKINNKQLGGDHHKTIKSLSALGVLAYSQGDYPLALDYFEQVAKARLERLGEAHILTASAYNRLGATYYEAGQYTLSEKSLKKALAIFKQLNLSHSMKYARSLNNLGLVERQKGMYKKAKETFNTVKQIETLLLGEKHIDVAGINNNLGMVSADLGEFSLALSLFKKAYNVMYSSNQLNHVNIAFSMTNIGRMYLQMDDIRQAEEWINQALELRRKKLGDENLYYAESLSALIEVDIVKGNLNKAKKKLENVLSIRKNQLPEKDWRILESEAIYALLTLENNQESEQIFHCNLSVIAKKLGANHYRVVRLNDKQTLFKLTTQTCLNP